MIENIGAYSQVDYDRGYQQGRADAIKQYHKAVENNLLNATFDVIVNDNILEHLKEQKNEW